MASGTLPAQGGLPDYGVVRVPGPSLLTEGTAPGMAAQLGGAVAVQGFGWNTEDARRGWFFAAYDGVAAAQLAADTARVRSQSDPAFGGAVVVPGGLLTLRKMVYRSRDPRYRIGGSAVVVELVRARADDRGLEVVPVDSVAVTAEEIASGLERGWFAFGVRELGGWQSDTVRVFTGMASLDPALQARAELRSYVPDGARGYRLAKTLRLADGIIFEDFPLCAWTAGDTLGRLEHYGYPREPIHAAVRYFNRHTGRLLGVHRVKDDHGLPHAVPSPANGLGYMTVSPVVEPPGGRPRALVEVDAFDLRTARPAWRRTWDAPPGWHHASVLPVSRVDSTGHVAVTAYEEGRDRSAARPDRHSRVVVRAHDARAGDSLWVTRVRLDSAATDAWTAGPMDVAVRPGGRGYVVACWTADYALDANRPELGYAYTTLIFLDSLGCAAPGCRDASGAAGPAALRGGGCATPSSTRGAAASRRARSRLRARALRWRRRGWRRGRTT